MGRETKGRKLHYGWWVVLAGALLLICNLSLTMNVFSIFLTPLEEKLHLSSTQVGTLPSIQTLTGVFMFALSGTLYSRFSIRIVCTTCGCFTALGYLLYCCSNSLALCYLAAVCLGIGYGGSTMMPVSLLVTNWFQERKATALAIASIGTGFSTIVFPPVLSSLITNYGVSAAFLFLAGVIALLMLISLLIVRDTPQEKGMLPYGAACETTIGRSEDLICEAADTQAAGEDEDRSVGNGIDGVSGASAITLRELFRTGHFRLYILASLLLGTSLGPLLVRLSPIVQSFGFSPDYGALMVSLCGGALILGKFSYGIVNDRYGGLKANYFIFSLWFSGLLLYFFLNAVPVLMPLFVFLFGFSMAHGTLSLPIWSGDLYNPVHYAKVLSYAKTMYTIGNAAGMLIPGFAVDHFGSYHLAIAFFFLASGAAFLILLHLYRHPLKAKEAVKSSITI